MQIHLMVVCCCCWMVRLREEVKKMEHGDGEAVIIGGMVLDIHATPSMLANPGTTTPGKVSDQTIFNLRRKKKRNLLGTSLLACFIFIFVCFSGTVSYFCLVSYYDIYIC